MKNEGKAKKNFVSLRVSAPSWLRKENGFSKKKHERATDNEQSSQVG